MKIGDLARETGVSIRLLRYYEDQRLLASHRTSGGHRHYTADAPTTVTQIRTLLAAGLPTRVIQELMPCFIGDGPTLDPCVQDHLRTQLLDLDSRITNLQHARASLSDLLDASARASQPTAASPS